MPSTGQTSQDAGASLRTERHRDKHSSRAEKVAAVLRGKIIQGELLPGARLSEESLGLALGVSRNTLREVFRLLAYDRLVVHKLNRGVFVRVLTTQDISDVYSLRRIVEGAAARRVEGTRPVDLTLVRSAVET
ncbi:MAG: GntR family transcriptional regulator, partial [Dermatophilaceae bacterium]